jgi:hypothetical protein
MNYLRLLVLLVGVAVMFAVVDIVEDLTALINDRSARIQSIQ